MPQTLCYARIRMFINYTRVRGEAGIYRCYYHCTLFHSHLLTKALYWHKFLDLLVTSIPDKIEISEVLQSADARISTDHTFIIFNLIMACNPLPKTKRSVLNCQRADFDGLRAHLRSVNFKEKISDHGDIGKN